MCGVAGIVVARHSPPPSRERVELATRALRHRGPDEIGFYHTDAASLGHTRLSIIDPEHGSQPLFNENRTVVTAYNGEIWNHDALRRELQAAGHVFDSRVDTEVLVHGYEEWGEGLLQRLHGIFAFALWDAGAERLLLARDRIGKQPLYVALTEAGLAFGSDARTPLIIAGLKPELDRERLPEFLFQRYIAAPRTLFRGVEKLLPGDLLIYDRERIERRPYWRLAPTDPEPMEPAELRCMLRESVRDHLMSDVPLGMLLSGGIDSTSILALMSELGLRSIPTFTIGYTDPLYDERPPARMAARHFGTDHHEIVIDERDFLNVLPRLAWYRGEPIAEPSEIPLLLLTEYAGRHVKVVLTGDGGDELFGGFPKYRAERVLRGTPLLPVAAFELAGRIAALRPSHRRLRRAVDTLSIHDQLLRWASWFRSFSPGELQHLVANELRPHADPALLTAPLAERLGPYEGLDDGRRMMLGDFLTSMPDNMLVRADKILMGASVEGRPPILDHRIVERVSNVPASERSGLRTSKVVFRKAVADLLPRELLRQPKRGFTVPIARFLVEDETRALERLVLSERARDRGLLEPSAVEAVVAGNNAAGTDRDLKIFTLAMLELWLRTNVDELRLTPPETLGELLDSSEAEPALLRATA